MHTGTKLVSGVTNVATVNERNITAQSVAEANSTNYRPRALPAAFTADLPKAAISEGSSDLPKLPANYIQQPSVIETIAPPEPNVEPYRLGTGDVVFIATPQLGSTVEQLSGLLAAENSRQGYTIQDSGQINIPTVGRVAIGGLTLNEAETVILEALVNNRIDPTFSIEIAEFNSKSVSVSGAVARPSVLPITLTPLKLDSAIAAAGGVTAQNMEFASVRLFRAGEMFQIPIIDLYKSDALLNIQLIDGDIVYVDTEYNITEASRYFEQQIRLKNMERADQDIALRKLKFELESLQLRNDDARRKFELRQKFGGEQRDFVYVTGEVMTQSQFALPYERQASLAEALFGAAGGINLLHGDVSKIYVLRTTTKKDALSQITAWKLDGKNAAAFAVATQFELRPDDVIFVATQPVTKWSRVMSQILPGVNVIDGSSAVEARSF